MTKVIYELIVEADFISLTSEFTLPEAFLLICPEHMQIKLRNSEGYSDWIKSKKFSPCFAFIEKHLGEVK